MLLRVDPAHLASLVSHLVAQGFPASPVDDDGLFVLFPATPALFPAAAELEDWAVRVGADDAVRIES